MSRRKTLKIQDASDTSTCTEIEEDESSSSLMTTTEQRCDSTGTIYESRSSLNSFRCAYSDVRIPKIDTSTAYILFYERSGLDYKPYLPKVAVANGQTTSATQSSHVPEVDELEDRESELRKQLCTVQ